MSEEPYEVIFEAKIRYVRPRKFGSVDTLELVLYALSVDEMGRDIYRYLMEKRLATPEEIAEALDREVVEVQDRLDYMYSMGLIDKLGKAYMHNESLATAIRRRTSKRIVEILDHLADMLEGMDSG